VSSFIYDNSDINSVLKYAKKLQGKKISQIINEKFKNIDIKNKGIIGNVIEECYFGIKQNSSMLPDFQKIGVELKIIPLIKHSKKIAVKERTKVCSINYITLAKEDWENSHAKNKLNKILFIYYLYDKKDIKNSIIKKVDLWELAKDKSELIILDDWLKVKQKVVNGYAHLLSEKEFCILSPSRSGSGGVDKYGQKKDLVPQPNQIYEKKALKRAFSLKQSFTNQIWNELNNVKYESILEILNISEIDDFELKIIQQLNKYNEKSISELSSLFDIKIPNGKNQVATIIKKTIGFKSVNSKIKEFEQLGIVVKTIKLRRKDCMPLEAISFPTMKLKEFEKECYENSTFRRYIEKILFIPIYSDSKLLDENYLGKAFFWTASQDEDTIIKKEWKLYQKKVLNGACKVTKVKNRSKKGYKEVSDLPKESDTKMIHLRPHGRDSNDRDFDSLGNTIVKQCFWLNKKFIQKLVIKSSC